MRQRWNKTTAASWVGALSLIAMLGCESATSGGSSPTDTTTTPSDTAGADTLADTAAGGDSAGGTDAAQPGSDSTAGATDAAEPGSDTAQQGSDTAQPGSDAAEPGSDIAEPGSDTAEPGSDTAEPGSDTAEPGSDAWEPGSDATEPGSDTTQPGSDSWEPGSDAASGSDTASCTPNNGGNEACDGQDNDCDGETDEGDTICGEATECASYACVPCVGEQCDGPKKCAIVAANEGQPCGAGNQCQTGATCQSASCLGTAVNCDDNLSCTADSCDPASGCQHTVNNVQCDDANVCTDDVCDLSVGCTATANSALCDDGDVCTSGSACVDKVCTGNAVNSCDDGVSCTMDSCYANSGCYHAPSDALCDDGANCTTDTCDQLTGCKAAAIPSFCNDNNVCTTDSCGAAGCLNDPLPDCDPCITNTDCNDGKFCTTDTCNAGKCVYTAPATCPTNYVLDAIVVTPSPVAVGGALTYKATVSNFGVAGTSTYAQKLRWKLILSKDDVVDAGDLYLYENVWGAYNVQKGNTTATDTQGIQISAPASFQHKYACVELKYAADGDMSDNTKCVPIEIQSGEAGLVALAEDSTLSSNGDPTGNGSATLKISWNNPGTASHKPALQLYLSSDGTWDAQDKLVGSFNNATVPVGQSDSTVSFTTDPFNSTTSGKQWVCLRADAAAAASETNPDDNTLCAQIDIKNQVNFTVDVGFSGGGPLAFVGGISGTQVYWGQEVTCKMSNLFNAGTGIADLPYDARCYLAQGSVAPGGTVPFSAAEWTVDWVSETLVPGAGPSCYNCVGKATLEAPYTAPVQTQKVGSYNLCFEVNAAKTLAENNYSQNVGCLTVTIVGGDLFVGANNTQLPATVTPGSSYQFEFAFGNSGNQNITVGATKMKGKILLSTDQTASADDILVWEGEETNWASYDKPGNFQTYYSMSPNYPTKLSFTMPSAAAGSYYFVLVIDADDVIPEPNGNNTLARAVTVMAPPN